MHFYRWEAQEEWSEGPSITQGVRSIPGLEWGSPHPSQCSTFSAFSSSTTFPLSHLLWNDAGSLSPTDSRPQGFIHPDAYTSQPLGHPPLQLGQASFYSSFFTRMLPGREDTGTKCWEKGRANGWMSGIWWCGTAWQWPLFSPSRQTSLSL